MVLGPITQELIDQVIAEIKKEETQIKIRTSLVDPLIKYLHSKVYTYLQFLGLLMGIMIFLLFIILYMVWNRRL